MIKKIDKAKLVHDLRQQLWWVGRVFQLAAAFEPIPDDDYSDDYVDSAGTLNYDKTKLMAPSSRTSKLNGLLEYKPKL